MARKHLIIGCGAAGLSALEKIRSITWDDEVKIVTAEDYLPYSPTVLPYLFSGKIKDADIWIKDKDYFHQMKCTLARNKEVLQVIPDKKQVVYRDETRDDYDTLLIASGSEPARPAIRGLDKVDFIGIHTLEDYHRILQQLQGKTDIAILGAGLIGMEMAIALSEKGYRVKVIEKENRLLPLYFEKEAAAYIEAICADEGIQIFTNKEVSEIKRSKEGVQIRLSDGGVLNADVIITAIGVKARTSFLNGTGIKINKGILVDGNMRTNIEGIYAAGDVAEAPDFFNRKYGVNATIPSAVNQGKVAGANMAGEPSEYQGWVPMNVLNFFGHTACSIGSSLGEDSQVLKEKDDKERRYKKLVFDGDKLIGAMFLDVDIIPGVILYLVEKRLNVEPYKQMLLDRTMDVSCWLMLETERKETLFSALVEQP